MSPETQYLLDRHVEAIRHWHRCKEAGDQKDQNSVLVAQGMMRQSAGEFAKADAAEREPWAARAGVAVPVTVEPPNERIAS